MASYKLTAELTAEIVAKVSAGVHPEVAAIACGVSRASFYEWKRKGLNGEEPFAAFWTAVARAEAESEVQMLQTAQTGDEVGVGFGRSKSAYELIQLRFPKRWSKQIKIEMADQLNTLLDKAQKVLDQGSFERLLAALADESESTDTPLELPTTH